MMNEFSTMPPGGDCPPREVLVACSTNRLDAAHTERVRRHCEKCPRCRDLLSHLTDDRRTVPPGEAKPALVPTEIYGKSEKTVGESDTRFRVSGGQGSPISFGVGSIIGDRYELLAFLGGGGFGSVWKAGDMQLHREVAIKIAHGYRLVSEKARERYRREARIVAGLKHPGLVPVFDCGETVDGIPFIVSELAPSQDLGHLLKENPRRFSESNAAELAACLAEALNYAHEKQILHRDVKPGNVLLDGQGRPLLTDFGLAKAYGSEDPTLTVSGDLMGTVAYMSPEQAKGGRRVDHRSDLYSLGVILFELLAGRRPFEGDTASILYQQAHDEPRFPEGSNISPGLRAITLKCLMKDPGARYQSGAELASDLRAAVRGDQVTAVYEVRQLHARRWFSRWYPLATSILIMGLLVTWGAAGWLGRKPAASDLAVMMKDKTPVEVRFATEPPDARVGLARLNPENQEPDMGSLVVIESYQPRQATLTPGTYRIEVQRADGTFQEFLRTVPYAQQVETQDQQHVPPHLFWNRGSDGSIRWKVLRLQSDIRKGIEFARFEGGRFTVGACPVGPMESSEQGVIVPHERDIQPFWLQTQEVSQASIVAVPGPLDSAARKAIRDRNELDHAITNITFDQAVHYCELTGCRLPTEFEYEFAATAGGKQPFPWGGQPITRWITGKADEPSDQTATDPPVYGLFSGVAEWTQSIPTTYPGAKNALEVLGFQAEEWRIVRGLGEGVVDGQPERYQGRSGPCARGNYQLINAHVGLGFRCAKSVAPRLLTAQGRQEAAVKE